MHLDLTRFEVRVPAPKRQENRTGLIVLDLHDVYYSHQPAGDPSFKSTRFDVNNEQNKEWSKVEHYTDSARIRRLVLAHCALGKLRATGIVSIGPIQDPGAVTNRVERNPSLFPCAMFRPATKSQQSNYILFNIPSVYASIDKANFDGLQLWVDHIGQWADKLSRKNTSSATTRTASLESSILGSKFFLHQGQSKGTETSYSVSTPRLSGRDETIVRVTISEGKLQMHVNAARYISTDWLDIVLLRLSVPTNVALENTNVRPIDASLSDLDVIFEMNPGGKV